MNAQIGDVVQIDGGLVIVMSIKGDRANIKPVTEFKGRRPHALDNGINVDISRDRLFERRGEAGVADFLAEQAEAKSGKHKDKIKAECGDMLCYEGGFCTVFQVTADGCVLGDLDGNVWQDDRWLSEFFFRDCVCHQLVRLNEKERAENLVHFLSQRKSPLPETETSDETETPHIETVKTKTDKSKKSEQEVFKTRADAPVASKAEKSAKPSRSNALFGSSICRVAMTAGAAGVTYEQFAAFITKSGLEISEATARQNIRLGKSGKMVGAVLTKQQIEELKK
jgi:hypothetical protein